MIYEHYPVLLQEVLELLQIKSDENYIDGTLGGGGYTSGILEKNSPNGEVLSFDLDLDSFENFKNSEVFKMNSRRVHLVHANFKLLDNYLNSFINPVVSGVVADLGFSSYQLDKSGRGIAFQRRELLDMRFDSTAQIPTAAYLLNSSALGQIIGWLENYGEEKFSTQIAKQIVRRREVDRFKSTEDLVECIKLALPKPVKHKWEDSARRVFQAMRIAVNHELDSLEEFLPKAFEVLKPGGRLVVVTFHSLEDRIVKNYFKKMSTGCVCPPEFPICTCGKAESARVLTKKPIVASESEIRENSRSKSAKLRALEKIS